VLAFPSPESLRDIGRRLPAVHKQQPDSFEALLSVTSFGQTDVAAEILDVHALPNAVNEKAGTHASPSER
jgi:ankyrin repeat protein